MLKKTLSVLGLLSALAFSQTTGNDYSWSRLKFGGGGFVTGFATHKSGSIFARTDVGGAYRWDRTTGTWSPVTDAAVDPSMLGVVSIAIDPQNASNVYLLSGLSYATSKATYLSKSTDGGATFGSHKIVSGSFKQNGNGTDRNQGGRLAVSPFTSGSLLAGAGYSMSTTTPIYGVWQSVDDGATWTRCAEVPNQYPVAFVAYDPKTKGRMYAGLTKRGNVNIYRSNDYGVNWDPLTPGSAKTQAGPVIQYSNSTLETSPVAARPLTALLDSMIPQNYAMTSNGDLIVAFGEGKDVVGGADEYNFGAVIIINSKGVWSEVTPEVRLTSTGTREKRDNYSGITVSAQSNRIFGATTIGNNHATRWQECAACETRADNLSWGSGVFTSRDSGNTWVNQIRSYQPSYTAGVKDNGKADGYPALKVDELGPKWAYRNMSVSWGANIAFDPLNSGTAFLTGDLAAFRSDNINTTTTTWELTEGIEELVVKQIIPLSGGVKLMGALDLSGWRAEADGSWPLKKFLTADGSSLDGSTYALDVPDKNPAWVARVGVSLTSITISSDTGKTWNVVPRPVAVTAEGGNVLWNADGSALLLMQGGKVWRSTNHGTSFTQVTTAPYSGDVSYLADPINPKLMYVYNRVSGAFWLSSDAGASWSQITIVQPNIRTVTLLPGRSGELWVIADTKGYLVYTIDAAAKTVTAKRAIDADQGVSMTYRVFFGRGKTTAFPAVYAMATINASSGLFRSDDSGLTWVQVDDAAHQFGSVAGITTMAADPDVYGRVYLSASTGNGLGVLVGDLPNSAPTMTLGYTWKNSAALTDGFTLYPKSLTDLENDIDHVDYYVNNDKVGTADGSSNYSFTYGSLVWSGNYKVQAKIFDKSGAFSWSNSFSITLPFAYNLTLSGAANWYGGLCANYKLPSTFTSGTMKLLSSSAAELKTLKVTPGSTQVCFTGVYNYPAGQYYVRLSDDYDRLYSVGTIKVAY